MKRTTIFIVLFALVLSLTACSKTTMKKDFFPNAESSKNIVSADTANAERFILPQYLFSSAFYINEIEAAPVYQTADGSNHYLICKFRNPDAYLFVLYDENGLILDNIYTFRFYSKNDFSSIKIGQSEFKEVSEIDSSAILLTEDGTKATSLHWLKNDKYMIIYYDNNIVTDKVIFDDEYHFYSILKASQDYDITELSS